jgi:hypothetical protein
MQKKVIQSKQSVVEPYKYSGSLQANLNRVCKEPLMIMKAPMMASFNGPTLISIVCKTVKLCYPGKSLTV